MTATDPAAVATPLRPRRRGRGTHCQSRDKSAGGRHRASQLRPQRCRPPLQREATAAVGCSGCARLTARNWRLEKAGGVGLGGGTAMDAACAIALEDWRRWRLVVARRASATAVAPVVEFIGATHLRSEALARPVGARRIWLPHLPAAAARGFGGYLQARPQRFRCRCRPRTGSRGAAARRRPPSRLAHASRHCRGDLGPRACLGCYPACRARAGDRVGGGIATLRC